MNITQVKIKEVSGERVKAMATVTLNNELVLTGLKVIEGANGTFVSMPSTKGKEGDVDARTGKQKYYDVYYPITAEARTQLIEAVLAEYQGKQEVKKEEFVEIDEKDDFLDGLPF